VDITLLKDQLALTLAGIQELFALSHNSDYELSVRALVCSRELARLIAGLEAL
jgi:hypothetical protein